LLSESHELTPRHFRGVGKTPPKNPATVAPGTSTSAGSSEVEATNPPQRSAIMDVEKRSLGNEEFHVFLSKKSANKDRSENSGTILYTCM